jgi:protein-tyrosine phosphatase
MAVDPDPTQVMEPEQPTQEMPTQETQQVSDNFQYEEFRVEERLSLVKGRLRDLESQHYNKRLDLIVADEGQADPIMEQVATLESKINELRQEEQGVEAQVETPEPPQ